MNARTVMMIIGCLTVIFSVSVSAAEADSMLTIDRIFHDKEFELDEKVPSKWLEGGASYTTVDSSKSVADGFDIKRHTSATGKESILVSAKQLIPKGADKPLEIKDYRWSGDGQFVLISTNTVKFRREESFGDYWLLNLANSKLRQVGVDASASSLMYAKFSPDAKFIAYMYLNNIYIESIDGLTIKQLTHDGSDLIVNGTGDWVNEEEFSLRDGFKWSPDSTQLCFWQFDTEGVGTFYMIKNTGDVYSQPIPLQYPKAGTTNSATRAGVVNIESGKTVWIKLQGDARQNYVPQMDWAANSDQLIIQYVNRLQNRNKVFLANAADGSAQHIFTDADDAWVDANEDVKWLEDGKYFTWLSERDGWRHLYKVSRDGKEVTLVTPGDFDIIKVDHIDTDNGWVYYTASPNDNAARYLYRSPLAGEPAVERLTPQSESGFHEYEIATNSEWAFHTFSTLSKPPTIDIVSLPDHGSHRIIVDNTKIEKLLQSTP